MNVYKNYPTLHKKKSALYTYFKPKIVKFCDVLGASLSSKSTVNFFFFLSIIYTSADGSK